MHLRLYVISLAALIYLVPSNYIYARNDTDPQILNHFKNKITKADSELNKQYQKTYRKLVKIEKADLRYLQRLWLRNRDEDCKLKENLKHNSQWIDSIKSVKKAICVSTRTESRVVTLADVERQNKKIQSQDNVCAALKAAVLSKVDRKWMSARDGYTTEIPLSLKSGEIVIENGKRYPVDFTGAKTMGLGKRASTKYLDLEGDGTEEILLMEPDTRTTSQINIFKLNEDSRYVAVPGGSNYGDRPRALYYHGKTYLIYHNGLYSSPTGYKVLHYSKEKQKILDYCSIGITTSKPKYRLKCSVDKVCKKISNNPKLLTNISEHWDLAPNNNISVDINSITMHSNWTSRKKTWVDLDNDGVNELALIVYGGPNYIRPFPEFARVKNNKLHIVDIHKEWDSFTLGRGGFFNTLQSTLFITNDGKLNYVVIRQRPRSTDTVSRKGFVFFVILVKQKDVKRIGEVTVEYRPKVEVTWPTP